MNNINLNEWHYWGKWKECLLTGSPWTLWSLSRVFEDFNLHETITGDVLNYHGNYLCRKSDIEKFKKIILPAFEEENEFLEKLLRCCKLETEKFKVLDKGNDVCTMFERASEMVACSIIIHLIDRSTEQYLQDKCKKAGIAYSELPSLIHVKRNTPLMEYYERLRNMKEIDVDSILKEFAWTSTYIFSGEPLTHERLEYDRRGVLESRADKAEKVNIPTTLKRITSMAAELSYYRMTIVELLQKVVYSYWRAIAEAGKKHGLTYEETTRLTFLEFIEMCNQSILPSNFKERTNQYGLEVLGRKYYVITGLELQKKIEAASKMLFSDKKEVKGQVAFKGRVIGKARVMQETKDREKVQEGDILIAHETTPDYIIAMRKASAFITNLGGITSHAAIIAREMKKPCVIGTKIATAIFKDGDIVEVDAEKGIVRLVERKGA